MKTGNGASALAVMMFILGIGGCAAAPVDEEAEVAMDADEQELVSGLDNRIKRSAVSGYPWGAHVALRRSPNATTAYCSGFKISPRHILTAAHCLYWQGTDQSTPAAMRVVRLQDGNNTGVKYTPQRFWIPAEWKASTPNAASAPNWNFDYALITLPDQNNTPGWFDFRAQPDPAAGLVITASGYPAATSACVNGPNGRCGGWLYSATGTIDRVHANMFVTRVDWESGQSGGPISFLPANATERVAIGIISNERLPAQGVEFEVGVHGNRALRITPAIQAALCARINVERPSTLLSHHCYQ